MHHVNYLGFSCLLYFGAAFINFSSPSVILVEAAFYISYRDSSDRITSHHENKTEGEEALSLSLSLSSLKSGISGPNFASIWHHLGDEMRSIVKFAPLRIIRANCLPRKQQLVPFVVVINHCATLVFIFHLKLRSRIELEEDYSAFVGFRNRLEGWAAE